MGIFVPDNDCTTEQLLTEKTRLWKKPVSNKKIWMELDKLRYPISPGRMMYDKGGIENHLTEEDKTYPKKYIFSEEDEVHGL